MMDMLIRVDVLWGERRGWELEDDVIGELGIGDWEWDWERVKGPPSWIRMTTPAAILNSFNPNSQSEHEFGASLTHKTTPT